MHAGSSLCQLARTSWGSVPSSRHRTCTRFSYLQEHVRSSLPDCTSRVPPAAARAHAPGLHDRPHGAHLVKYFFPAFLHCGLCKEVRPQLCRSLRRHRVELLVDLKLERCLQARQSHLPGRQAAFPDGVTHYAVKIKCPEASSSSHAGAYPQRACGAGRHAPTCVRSNVLYKQCCWWSCGDASWRSCNEHIVVPLTLARSPCKPIGAPNPHGVTGAVAALDVTVQVGQPRLKFLCRSKHCQELEEATTQKQ